MGLLEQASLVITPTAVKTGKLYSVIPNDGTGDLTVERNTSATRINENGNIVDVSANVARIDYSNINCPAILVEPLRTNLVYPSDIATTQVRAVTAQIYTLSFYGSGSVALSGAYGGTLNGTGTNNKVSLTFTPIAGNLTLTVIGSVANWQLEAGSNTTSLIKTISGSVTRNADVISNTNASTLIGQTEGCLFLDFVPTTVDSTARYISISNSSSTSNGWFGIFASPSKNTFRFYGDGFDVNIGTLILNNRYKIVLNYKNGVVTKIFINGVNVSTITANTTGKSYNLIQLSTAPIGTIGNANFNCISLFKNIISDQQAIQLTTL